MTMSPPLPGEVLAAIRRRGNRLKDLTDEGDARYGDCHPACPAGYGRTMTGRYDPSDLTTYGAMDDQELDMILDALDRATEDEAAP
jgi:hypothetical protein